MKCYIRHKVLSYVKLSSIIIMQAHKYVYALNYFQSISRLLLLPNTVNRTCETVRNTLYQKYSNLPAAVRLFHTDVHGAKFTRATAFSTLRLDRSLTVSAHQN